MTREKLFYAVMLSVLIVVASVYSANAQVTQPSATEGSASSDSVYLSEAEAEKAREQRADDNEHLSNLKAENKVAKDKSKEAQRVEREATVAAKESKMAYKSEKRAQKARKQADMQSKKAERARVKSDKN
jgi:hypothetical protein